MSLRNNTRLKEACDFGDGRLDKRIGKICNKFSRHLEESIPQSIADRSQMKAGYNFFKNKKVTVGKIIGGHRDLHQEHRKSMSKQVLVCAHDKTELDFTGKKSAKGFGPLNHLNQRGCLLHNSLLMSGKGVPVGMFKQTNIIRADKDFGKRNRKRPRRPIEEKESRHWLDHFIELQDYFRDCPGVEVFCTNDREADIYELFAAQNSDNVHLIVRSDHNRALDGPGNEGLHDKVKSSPVKHTCTIKITDRRTCKKRKAKVQIRYTGATVRLGSPSKWQKKLPALKLWAVQVEEASPPKGYKPVQWVLLTTYPVRSIKDALMVNRYYVLRWVVERFHFVLKSGAKVKELQLKTPERVLNAVAVYSISAVNIMRINYLARLYPDMGAVRAGFETRHLRVLFAYVKAHIDKHVFFEANAPPNIRQTVVYIARMGGFTNFPNQPFPGLKTFWRGWSNFNLALDTAFAINVNEL